MTFSEKFLRTPGVIEVSGRQIKRYHVNTGDSEIEPVVQDAARLFLSNLVPAPDDEAPPAGFAVLHRAVRACYLNAYCWVWGNVLECHVAAAGIPWLGCPDDDPTNFVVLEKPWIGCVWELAAIEHERSAWVRHVLTPPTPDLATYLTDLPSVVRIGAPTT